MTWLSVDLPNAYVVAAAMILVVAIGAWLTRIDSEDE